jgi:hypothetical protein
LPGPLPDIDGALNCDFGVTPGGYMLRTTVHWSFHINLGVIFPGFVDNIVEDFVEDFMDPRAFGGTPIGDHAFFRDTPLSEVAFGKARFVYANALASPAGMSIGGTVRLPLDSKERTLELSVHPFGLPYILEFCRDLARIGSGSPDKTVPLGAVTTYASVWLEHLGAFCDYEILSPGNWIKPYVRVPTDTPELRIAIPSLVALAITAPVRFVVRTARGVRLIDFGVPPPAVTDATGNVTNALIDYIDNCLYLDAEHSVKWGKAGGLLDVSVVNPPLEHPDWTTYLGRHRGIDVQLLTLSALEPGELIRFHSRDHSVQVTADGNGRAVLPILLPVSRRQEAANLFRVNRRGIAGHVSVQTAIFMEQARLPAGTRHRLESVVEGRVVLKTEFKSHIDIHQIGSFGVPILLKRELLSAQGEATNRGKTPAQTKDTVRHELHETISMQSPASEEETALNPQSLPPGDAEVTATSPSLDQIKLRGSKSLIRVPGFAKSPVALVTMADGSTLVVDFSGVSPRVSGTFVGPIGVLNVAGDCGLAESDSQLSIYRVIRPVARCVERDRYRQRSGLTDDDLYCH